jgi:dUTP pyrophosphatase
VARHMKERIRQGMTQGTAPEAAAPVKSHCSTGSVRVEVLCGSTCPRPGMPRYMSEHASGFDLEACLAQDVQLAPGQRALIPTGLRLAIPRGFEGQVRPRSGLAAKHGVTVLNAPGTVDSDYRGEVGVILINLGSELYTIRHGDRIAQLVIAPTARAELVEVESLDTTGRGEGGFGSTGVSIGEESGNA